MWKGISPTKLKVGIHHDNIVFEKGDIFGKGVNFTFRINDLAKSGEIYISKAVYDNVQSRPDIQTTSKGNMNIEEFTDSYEIYSVNIPETFVPMDADLNIASVENISANEVNYKSIAAWCGAVLIIIFILFEGVKYYNKPLSVTNSISLAVFPFDNISENHD